MDMDSLMALFSFFFGLILGSFMNVCIYRMPLKKSIVRPPSHCPHCGERIRFYDNIPVISYLLLMGKCRYCRQAISWRYPAVEAIAGCLSLALFIRFGFGYQYFLFLLFVTILVTISFIDLRHKIIPDAISLPGIALGLGSSFFLPHITWVDSLVGVVAGGGILFLVAVIYERFTKKEGMGGGDIKLLAMIGAWMGWRSLPLILLVSSLSGSIIGFVYLLSSGKGYRARIPFGPFLSLGALIFFFFGRDLVTWYLRLLQ